MRIFLAFFLIASCTNLKHATSTNLSDIKHFRNNAAERDYWNQKIAVLKNGDETKCKFIGEVKGKDNVFDAGPEHAILYMKVNANKMGADAIVVKGNNTVGNYGNEAFGNAYLCQASESK